MRRPRRGLLVNVDEWHWWLAGIGVIPTPLEVITLRLDHLARTLQIDHETRTLRVY